MKKKRKQIKAERRAYFVKHGELPPSRRQQSKIDAELDKQTLADNPHLRRTT